VNGDQLLSDPAVLFRRLARGPDDCRRCGLPTVADQLQDVIVGRTCPSCSHSWTYPAPIDLDGDQLDTILATDPDPTGSSFRT
jgi:hypothetical protein